MNDVINFFFNIVGESWELIVSHWILSAFILISVLNWVITLVNGSTQE